MHSSSTEDSGLSLQRIKKREADRRCQRLARERTKSRLANLESLVADLQKNDESGRVGSLVKHIAELTEDKDKLLRTLRSIRTALDVSLEGQNQQIEMVIEHTGIDAHGRDLQAGHQDWERDAQRKDTGQQMMPTRIREVSEEGFEQKTNSAIVTTLPKIQVTPFLAVDSREGTKSPAIYSDRKLSFNQACQSPPYEKFDSQSRPQDPIDYRKSPLTGLSLTTNLMSQSRDPNSLDCPHCATSSNIWRFANRTLLTRPTKDDEILAIEDRDSQDALVLAILYGWDHVEKIRRLTSVGRIIRQIDEAMFVGQLLPLERMATLHTLHTLMMYHIDPSVERLASLPRWFLLRPSQTLPHAYATDYFPWPGVRERFVFFEHRYCRNNFWDLLRKNFRILWSYDLRDVYRKNIATGQFEFSTAFRDRLSDIDAWTCNPDFFNEFPELQCDIRSSGTIPKSVSNSRWMMDVSEYRVNTAVEERDQSREHHET